MSDYFQDNLIYLMQEYKMKQRDLAIRTGSSVSTINDYVKGRMKPKYDKLEWISIVFNVDVSDILHRDLKNDNTLSTDDINKISVNFITEQNNEYYKQYVISETDAVNLEKLIDNYFEMKKRILEDE
ncbi:helix-turn-helix transcriptional regulator [Staphylococcus pseudoxylosus]|uniref:helix-turn-helix domain-containing protein n=1 Tax=Staphylococcus pseudoxylosus TaxID=2282419 RepID=UPI002DBA969A|nr:helix-turn-helix transcriptional regulator [Staphylococcus pseudoxylosus]MEB8088226.1 helix-turn-helix transcriptional regulator [Staphylococcus pseudoxylosus]